MRKIIVWFFCFIPVLIFAQYDEKSILLNQANQLSYRGMTTKADTLFSELYKKYPEENIAIQWLNNALRLSAPQRVGEILKRVALSEPNSTIFTVKALLKSGEAKTAFALANSYLAKNSQRMELYPLFAGDFCLFNRFEEAIEIYLLARKTTADPTLNAYNLGLAYLGAHRYREACEEFLQDVKRNPGNIYLLNDKITQILQEEPSAYEVLAAYAAKNNEDVFKEMQAKALLFLKRYEEALSVYESLGSGKLYNYGLDLYGQKNYPEAEKVFRVYLGQETEIIGKSNGQIKLAEVLLALNKEEQAQQVLKAVNANEELKNNRNRYRTKALGQSCELLAEIALRHHDYRTLESYLEESKNYAYNQNDNKQAELKLAFYEMMQEKYTQAGKRLDTALQNETEGSPVMTVGYYYRFIYYAMQGDSLADKMLMELMINQPGYENATEMLYLKFYVDSLSEKDKLLFWQAYRAHALRKEKEAVDLLLTVYAAAKKEFVLVLGAAWALENGNKTLANELLSKGYTESFLKDYAFYLKQVNNPPDRKTIEDFLIKNPKSLLAPALRQLK